MGFSIGVPSLPVAGSRGGAVKCETATRFQRVQQQYRCETMCAGCTNGVCVCVYDSMYLCAHTTASVYASACACDSAMPVCDYAEAVAKGTTTYGRLGSLHDTCATISPGKFCVQSITAQNRDTVVSQGRARIGSRLGRIRERGKGSCLSAQDKYRSRVRTSQLPHRCPPLRWWW